MLGDKASQLVLKFSPKMWDGVEVRIMNGPVKFQTKLRKPFHYGPGFVCGGTVILKQERAFPELLGKIGSTLLSKKLLNALAVRCFYWSDLMISVLFPVTYVIIIDHANMWDRWE